METLSIFEITIINVMRNKLKRQYDISEVVYVQVVMYNALVYFHQSDACYNQFVSATSAQELLQYYLISRVTCLVHID